MSLHCFYPTPFGHVGYIVRWVLVDGKTRVQIKALCSKVDGGMDVVFGHRAAVS